MMCKWFEDLYSILNAMGICFFPAGFVLALGPTHLARLYSAATGRDTFPRELMQYGEKIFTLMKAYNIRQGMARKDDNWPDRFYQEPLPDGPARGAVLSRKTIDAVLDKYYGLRGWDPKTDLPFREKLIELGLRDIAGDLVKLGKLP